MLQYISLIVKVCVTAHPAHFKWCQVVKRKPGPICSSWGLKQDEMWTTAEDKDRISGAKEQAADGRDIKATLYDLCP